MNDPCSGALAPSRACSPVELCTGAPTARLGAGSARVGSTSAAQSRLPPVICNVYAQI